MEARVTWIGDEGGFVAESGSGHSVVMDTSPEMGGRDGGPRPMEMLLMGLGGCTAIDVVHILRKGRADVQGVEVRITGERAETVPKVFTRIHVHFLVTGAIDAAKVERAVALSAEKYCSASLMLGAVADINHSFEVIAP